MRKLKAACLLAFITSAAASAQSKAGATPVGAAFSPSAELNRQLPQWLRFSGDYRARFEGVDGIRHRDASDAYLLSRFRLNMKIQPKSWLKFNFQGQDARVYGLNQRPLGAPFQDVMDLRMAFVEIGDTETKWFGIRAGRQELVFGEQRLVGHGNWFNTARTFDAARLTLRHKGYRLDAFAASVVNMRDGEFNRLADGNNFHGLYGGIEKLVPNAVIEPYVFWRLAPRILNESGVRSNLDSKTAGFRWAGKLPRNFDYGTEIAKQTGGLGTDSVGAWAGHWRLGYTVTNLRFKPRFIGEYNFASGDRDAKDGRRGTFDILYPTPHDKYGLANQVGWKNIHHARFGPEFKPHAKWTIGANYHSWWLASLTDSLYSATGAALFRSPAGTAGRHVGQELDAQVFYTMNKQLQIAGGVGHIFPGAFLRNVSPGRAYTFTYLMTGYSF